MFERKLGIYVLSANSKARQEEVYVTTVEDTKKTFTKYEVERADRARELLARLGYPSTAKAIQMLNSGGIINCDITSSDLLRAEEIYGPPIASLKGKTVKNTATPNKDEEPVIVLLVLFCVSRINVVPSKADAIVISPWECFHKRKLDYSKNLKAGFGEYSGDESDINFQIGREDKREIVGGPEEANEDEAYQDYVDQVAKRYITVREHDIIYDPVEASQPDMIEQTDATITSNGVDVEGVVEAGVLQPEDNAGSESSRKDDHMESYEPRRDGLRSARAKPGRYTRKEVGMHLLRDPDSSHRREYGFHMTPEQAIDKLGIIGKRSVVKEVKQLLERKSWHGVHPSKIPEAERKKIIPCKMFV
eukprot:gene36522-biopygen8500